MAIMPTEMELTLEQTQQGVSYEVSISIEGVVTNEDGNLLEPTQTSSMVDPHGSEGYLKMVMEVPDSSWLTRSKPTCSYPTDKLKDIMKAQVHVIKTSATLIPHNLSEGRWLKLKNFKKDATLKLFKNGMSMSVQKSQVHKMAKYKMAKRSCLVDDLKIAQDHNVKDKFKEQAQS
ncbi:hypothetical protein Tco_0828155 [Tanacetum coccineum]